MNSTKLKTIMQRVINTLYNQHPNIINIIHDITYQKTPGKAVLVGGFVRDALLEVENQSIDIDIEIYGLTLLELENILSKYGIVQTIGKSFGILRINSLNIDWSIPRTDGPGRKPVTTLNPHATYKEAFARRDLTINAMGILIPTNNHDPEFIDPYNGLNAIKNKILKSPNPKLFIQDPLRYFRVMQFAGRFKYSPDQELYEIGKTINLENISLNRIDEEFYKLFTLAQKPSLGIDWIHKTERLKELMPELHAIIGVEQNPEWHPEGDVFEHSKQAMDAAALQTYSCLEDRYVMTITALCHDLGKAVSSKIIDGKIRSWGHEITGVPLAKSLLNRISTRKKLFKKILKLIRWHMVHISLAQEKSTPAAYKRLALKLSPETNCATLAILGICDKSGRNSFKGEPLNQCPQPCMESFLKNAEKYGVLHQPEKPILTGKDLLSYNIKKSNFGQILKIAYLLQIKKNIKNKEQLIKLIRLKSTLL